MLSYTARLSVPVPATELLAWHERPGAFARLTPPWQSVEVEHMEGIRDGDRAVFRVGAGPVRVRWVAEHSGYSDACAREPGGVCGFTDTQIEGPFAAWTHEHRMFADGADAAVLEDHVAYALPGGVLGRAVGAGASRAELDRLFGYRHRVTLADLARHQAWRERFGERRLTVAVSGASGLIGSALCAFLTGGGHTVVRLVRSRGDAAAQNRGPQERAVYWDPARGEIDQGALALAAPDAVVHLAGESILAASYTAEKKRRIWESRTQGTALLARAVASLETPPTVFLSGSASGYYGSPEGPVTEASPPGEGFLADVCRAWEAAAAPAVEAGIRTAYLRTGLVLSPAGGMLGLLGPAAKLGLGGWIGDGEAIWPWIALDDVVYAIAHALGSDRLEGPVNLSAPTPVASKAFVETLGTTVGRPAFLSAPEGLVRRLGGEAAREVALASVRMLPTALLADGFRPEYPTLAAALRHLTGHADGPRTL